MYNLYGIDHQLKNVLLLVRANSPDRTIDSISSLREGVSSFFNTVQPTVARPDQEDVYVTEDIHLGAQLIKFFEYDANGRVLDASSVRALLEAEAQETVNRPQAIRQAIRRIQALDPQLGQLFQLIIRTVFSYPTDEGPGAGTSANALGVIWTYCSYLWKEQDIAEMLLHEFTHNLVFLNERIQSIYSTYKVLEDPENQPISAIRKTPRRLDFVVDSLIVAVELLLFRERFGWHGLSPVLHPPSEELVRNARQSLQSIYALKNFPILFSSAGCEMLHRCEAALQRFPHLN